MFSLRFAAHSEVGRVRKNNQDSAYASGSMLLVCDGMGGAAAGDLASAVAALEAQRSDRRLDSMDDMQEAIAGIILRANSKLGELIEEDLTIDGMGTTFCGAMFNGTQLAVGHIGDSRGYLLRDGELFQLTHDHSWVQSLIDDGKITQEQAATHPHRSLIMKVLNGQDGFEPDLLEVDLELGDRILFCSDGLSGLVSDAAMAEILNTLDIEDAALTLAAAANTAGGHDNITLVIGEVVEQDDKLDKAPGQLFGSALTVEVPIIGELAAKAGKASGYPEPAPVAEEEEPTDQEPEETARYAPEERKRRISGMLFLLVAVVFVIGGGAWGLQTYANSRYYVAAEEGAVTIFNGIPGSILGYPLHRVEERTDIPVDDLPAHQQRLVRDAIPVDDLPAARTTTEQLRHLADECRASREERIKASASAQPSGSPETSSPASGAPLPSESASNNEFSPSQPTRVTPMSPTPSADDSEHC